MRYTDQQLDEINAKTTASKEDNACVVLPLVWDLQDARKEIERVRQLALDIELRHVDALIAIRKEYGEWLYHLGRFGLTSDQHRKDTAVYLRRIANRLNGSATAEALRELASAVPSSILRDEQPADPPADREQDEDEPLDTPEFTAALEADYAKWLAGRVARREQVRREAFQDKANDEIAAQFRRLAESGGSGNG